MGIAAAGYKDVTSTVYMYCRPSGGVKSKEFAISAHFPIERALPQTLCDGAYRVAFAYINGFRALEIHTHVTYQVPQAVDVARQVLIVQRDEIEGFVGMLEPPSVHVLLVSPFLIRFCRISGLKLVHARPAEPVHVWL
eukprot:2564754-Pleurochrysis_carterae.AAC.1